MKLIFFSIDHNILDRDSAVAKRMANYGSLVDKLDIILFRAKKDEAVTLTDKVTVHAISGNIPYLIFKAISIVRNIALKDTIISVQDPFDLGLIGLVASKMSKLPLHIQVHIDFFSPYFKAESLRQRFQAVLAPFILRRAAGIRAVSKKIADYLVHTMNIPASHIGIAPVFVDPESVRQAVTTVDLHNLYPEFEWIALVASRHVKQKNNPFAIAAFEEFAKTHPKAGLVIAGSGPETPHIKDLIEEKGLQNIVKIGDWSKEFISCMRTADAFILSSDYEGWGMTVIEASLLSRPVVMTNVGCAGEFLINETNGLIVPVRDVTALVAAMGRYCDSRAFALNMAKNAERDSLSYLSREENNSLLLESWKRALLSHQK